MAAQPDQNSSAALNHVGVTVDNLEEAVEWYIKHLGFRRIRDDLTLDPSKPEAAMGRMIFGDKLNMVKMAWLTTGNGLGFEVLEFVDPPTQSAEKKRTEFSLMEEYQRGGIFHVAVTVPDPEEVAQRACEDGAVRIGQTIGLAGEKALYLRDPYGVAVELLSCGYQEFIAQMG